METHFGQQDEYQLRQNIKYLFNIRTTRKWMGPFFDEN